MDLPDLTDEIYVFVNALLNWSPFVALITISVAAAAIGVIISTLMRAFMRG